MQCDAKQVVSNTVDLIKHSFERYQCCCIKWEKQIQEAAPLPSSA